MLTGVLKIDGQDAEVPLDLTEGTKSVILEQGPDEALLLPEGVYDNKFFAGEDHEDLFKRVY